ncbi:MAG: hypothetical protein OIF57_11090, partial [Marinobacterium sp.]|nr:hypothetical protein [Marinobacterium sp.]
MAAYRTTPGDDSITGYYHADGIWAGSGDDLVYGMGGDDHLWGEGGHDALHGGDGDDFLNGGRGDDTLRGDKGNDVLWGDSGEDTIHGGEGNDGVTAGDGNDYVLGGTGNDDIWGNNGDDKLFGEEGDDTIRGGSGRDHVSGGEGDDYLTGGDGNDRVYGGKGEDVLDASGATYDFDILSGGEDGDRYLISMTAGDVVIIENDTTGIDTLEFEKARFTDLEFYRVNADANYRVTGQESQSGSDLLIKTTSNAKYYAEQTVLIVDYYKGGTIEKIIDA